MEHAPTEMKKPRRFSSLSDAGHRATVHQFVIALLFCWLVVTPALAGTKAATKVRGTTIDATLVWDSVTRYYEVYLPPGLGPNPAMLLMLHGTSTGSEPPIGKNYGWQDLADTYGFVLVQPASTYDPVSDQWNWNAYYMDSAFAAGEAGTCTEPPATGCPDDAGFLRQLIVTLTAQYNVNPAQVYVAGFSSGAQMTQRVAIEISDLVAAVVIGSGEIVGQPMPPPITLPGPPVAPISIQEWQGTLDHELPPCNNEWSKYSGVKFYLATVDQSFNYWTAQNACTQFQNTAPLCLDKQPNPNTTGNDATGCTNNTEVQFMWEEGVAHEWEAQNDTVRWQFLASHPMQLP